MEDKSVKKAKEEVGELECKILDMIIEFNNKWSGRVSINLLKPFKENEIYLQSAKLDAGFILGHGKDSYSPNGFSQEELSEL